MCMRSRSTTATTFMETTGGRPANSVTGWQLQCHTNLDKKTYRFKKYLPTSKPASCSACCSMCGYLMLSKALPSLAGCTENSLVQNVSLALSAISRGQESLNCRTPRKIGHLRPIGVFLGCV